jgi:nitroimidazol reductase NimA-like FMN-containing flavoprotein (pyridoxamine 5'-phosphate oxidase superfamily)
MADTLPVTTRTKLSRLPARGVFDLESIRAILDDAFVCHLGFEVDGQPFVIPTAYGRIDDRLYVHGSAASRTVRALGRGIEACVTVTIVDGLVLARSAFHHSINYRSVVVFGTARLVVDREEKEEALRAITNHIVPDRWEEVRTPSEQELKATSVLVLSIEEASAKVRNGPPKDDEEDLDWPVWAGVVPLRLHVGAPEPDAHLREDVKEFEVTRLQGRNHRPASRSARLAKPVAASCMNSDSIEPGG